MLYKYKAKKLSDGELIEGTRESEGKFSLLRELKEEGLSLLVAEGTEGGGIVRFLVRLNEVVIRIRLHDKIIFARNLAAMISAGLSLSRALEILEKQTTNAKFKKIMGALGKEIKDGGTLSSGLKKYPNVFSPLFVAIVHAGEESGGLAPSLKEIALHLDKNYALIKKVRGAMTYPAIILVAIFIIGALMLIYVVPTLTGTFKELKVELPASTQFIIFISDLLVNNTVTVFLGLVTFIIFFTLGLRTARGQKYFDFVLLRIPFIGNLVKQINSARTTRTLSSLLVAGVTITESLSITRDVIQNHYYKVALLSAAEKVQKGGAVAETFKENTFLFPVMVGEMIEVGEETGKVSQMLLDIATFYEDEVDAATKDLSTVVEPVLMVVIGAAVGFFAISMITPTYSLLNNI